MAGILLWDKILIKKQRQRITFLVLVLPSL